MDDPIRIALQMYDAITTQQAAPLSAILFTLFILGWTTLFGLYREYRKLMTSLAVGLILFSTIMGAFLFFQHTPATAKTASETLLVPFTKGITGVQTSKSYKGKTTITVIGIGQAKVPQWSDAFYVYTDRFGKFIKPQHFTGLYNWTLLINHRAADKLAQSRQNYNPDHTYTFIINAPGGHLLFAVGDKYAKDDSGSFNITVSSNA